MIGGIEETSASFEARSAPRSYPTKRQGDPSEKRYRRKDGKVIWVRVSAARALDSSSSLQGMPAIIEDITERKRAEGDLNDAREALSRATR
jgi:PAS domain S-box-containing protein